MHARHVLAGISMCRGDFEEAANRFRETVGLGVELADRYYAAFSLKEYADLLDGAGRPDDALELLLYLQHEFNQLGVVEAKEIEPAIARLSIGRAGE